VKPKCPLYKQPFTSIIHNVRSNQEYDEHKIPIPEPDASSSDDDDDDDPDDQLHR
jgi:E3 ubiquitin-protein ligase Topors